MRPFGSSVIQKTKKKVGRMDEDFRPDDDPSTLFDNLADPSTLLDERPENQVRTHFCIMLGF